MIFKNFIQRLGKRRSTDSSNTIWILYRIENNKLQILNHFTDSDRAKKWADASNCEIIISEKF